MKIKEKRSITLKSVLEKRSAKQDRERKVLLGLIEFFLKTGKPVGSNTLKEAGFEDLSSATIRNYFANLEEDGYLSQQHSSGGRIPTDRAYRLYAQEYVDSETAETNDPFLTSLRQTETREIASYLQNAADGLSTLTNCAVFLSAPRFDNDFLIGLKLVPVDENRCLCVLITDFGVIQTEVLPTEKKLTAFMVKRLEAYFHWRLTGMAKPEHLTREEELLGQHFYNELLVRFIVGYSNFTDEEIHRTGFSKLLVYPEFHNPISLAGSLTLFENAHSMRLMLKECSKVNHLKFWIGDDLLPYTQETPPCAVLSIPYAIGQQTVGAVGLMGPSRMPYRQLFKVLRGFSESISSALTRNIYKYKITFREPQVGSSLLKSEDAHLIGQSKLMLLENKTLN